MKTLKPILDAVIRLVVACERNPRGAKFATCILVMVLAAPLAVGAARLWWFA